MKNFWIVLIFSVVLTACKKVPISGRKQMTFLKESELVDMSKVEYDKFLSEHKVLASTVDAQRVKRIGNEIAAAVEQFYKKNKMEDRIKDFEWEFNLVDDPTVNAWCMPGGKVVFYTGILPVCMDDDGLAVVMGHEIAHAVAKHGNERMSQGLLTQVGAVALSVATSSQPEATQNMFMQAYGASATVGVLLPFSRTHESEADRLGLVFMTMAGYNPDQAPLFWGRMAALSEGNEPPAFISSHPSNAKRIKDITAYIPVARRYAVEYAAKP